MKQQLLLSALSITLLAPGCATILHGSRQEVSISSNPTTAIVTINGEEKGRAPITTKLSRKDRQNTIKIELEGYLPYETKLTRKVDGWIAGNIVFGGLIGLAVDAITGGMYKLTPDQVQAELRNRGTALKQTEDGLYFAVVLKPNSDWEEIGRLERID